MAQQKTKTRVCPGCGRVDVDSSRRLTSKHCSRACWARHAAGKHLRTGEELRCKNCGGLFYARGASVKRGAKYCSPECRVAHKAPRKRRCPECGDTFTPHNGEQRTCSHKCSKSGGRNPNWRGGHIPPRTPMPRSLRRLIYQRDSYTCQCCRERGGRLHIHHKFSWIDNEWGREDPGNCVVTCQSCHIRFHKQYGRGQNTESQWLEFCEQYKGMR
jgi:hypothetical protein